ncbi:MAG: acriflavine resistance protein B [Lentisphaerae bacterium RIFOXYB12_FULL_65_16]|nr:MAG: acriflavine resistance protein B [Lentisphaerae bacterium RIFOXYA12_64_32]OGV85698.1 MAG: acriflavine resistance protein B [Lentisphaerae bacterium RIFOXYB12_FULL_65_16]
MNISEIWIRRPVMTVMVTVGLLFFGLASYRELPINNLPAVDFPTISVTASLPGASPETMAATVATPLEKQFSSIASVDSMTSTSTLGVTTVNIQFALERQIDAAALDVSAAISAAMGVLPRNMPNPPTYCKVNPADMPIMFIALVSETLPVTTLNDFAENVAVPSLSAINGIAQVDTVPPQKYAVRIQVNPDVLARRKIGINTVSDALQAGNVNLPGGTINGPSTAYTLDSNGQLMDAKQFNSLIVTYQNGYPVRICDLGNAVDGVQNDKCAAWYLTGAEPQQTVVLRIRKQPGTNTVALAHAVREKLPKIRANMPGAMDMGMVFDQSEFIKESITDMQYTMLLTIALVIAVIFMFLRAFKPTVIPGVVVPLSLVATFIVMYLLGFTLNNLSLMALTLSIGFVVDDAVVVLENIIRRMEQGETAMEAALRGSREIGFTVLSMTLSLTVVFIPIMFMGGILGRLFREFATCIAAAILFSGFFSLTLTPMLCSRFLGKAGAPRQPGPLFRLSEHVFNATLTAYQWSLRWAMKLRILALIATVAVIYGTIHLFTILPKGFIPPEDQNYFRIFSLVDDKGSYRNIERHQEQLIQVLREDADCATATAVTIAGFPSENTGITFISLPPKTERQSTVDQVIARLRPKLNAIPGLIVSLVNPPVITIGSRLASAQWEFTLQSTDLDALYTYGAKVEEKMRTIQALTDVKSDLQFRKPRIDIVVDRDKASAMGLTLRQVQDAFYSAYGNRQVSTIYTSTNFYYVILELEPQFRDDPSVLDKLYLQSTNGELVPLKEVANFAHSVAPLAVNHSGQIPSATISFNLKPGTSIGETIKEIDAFARETLPASVHTNFQGTAQAFKSSFAGMGFLLLVTVIIIYLVLGILYESFIHPLTILTALPLAGFGALAALHLLKMPLDLYAYVGMIMLVGIVKKNGIMMVDFALEHERTQKSTSEESILEACRIRFRPIMMTTMAALIGTLPIALGWGAGGEARRPLGVAVVGGLLFSQLLTLYITPVFYVYLDKLNRWLRGSANSAVKVARPTSTTGG